MPAAPRRRLAALLLGPLMVIGLLLGLASPAEAQSRPVFPRPVGIGAEPDDRRTIFLYFELGVATEDIVLPIATGGTGDLTYSLTPARLSLETLGFSFDPTIRTFSATPALAGAGQSGSGFELTYAVLDTDGERDQRNVFVTVCEGEGDPNGLSECDPPLFNALGLVERVANQNYTVDMMITPLVLPEATGGTGTTPLHLYTLTGLPDGLNFNPATRTLSGTPTTVAESTITYHVADGATLPNDRRRFSQEFKLTVTAAPLALTAPPAQFYTTDTEITALELPEATGGIGELSYDLTGPGDDGALPDGLAFNVGSHTLSGTPTAAAITELTYTVTDSADTPVAVTQTFTVTVNDALALNVPDDQSYIVDTMITELELPVATGGMGDLTYTLTGPGGNAALPALPAGLSFDPRTRTLSGTPTAVTGATTLTYTVTDAGRVMNGTVSRTFTVTVNAAPLALTALPDQSYKSNRPIPPLVLPAATGGTGDLSYTLTDSLGDAPPAGLTFDAASRTLSGLPTVESTTILTYTVTDDNDGTSISQTFTVAVNSGLDLPRPVDRGYTVNTAIIALVLPAATGGTGDLSYDLTGPGGGTLPAGLVFDAASRTLSGTPTVEATTTLTYTVTDSAVTPVAVMRPFTVAVAVDATTPVPPVLFSAGTITDTSIALSWGAVTNAESYTLTRVVEVGADVVVATTGELTATDTGLTPETPYKYVVTATNSAGTSANSNEVDATTRATPGPGPAPSLLEVDENTTGVVARFTATATGTRTITGFTLGGDDAGHFMVEFIPGRNLSRGVVTFREPPNFEAPVDDNTDNSYEISITATDDSIFDDNLARMVTIRVTDAEDAGSVSIITGNAQVGMTLTAGTVTDEDSVGAISGYQWQRLPPGGGAPINIGGGQNTYEVVAADAGDTLRVVVSYTDGFGGNIDEATSAPTATVTAAPPGAPGGLTARPGDATVTLAWTAPGATGGADITGYEYRQSDATGDYDTTGSAAVVDWMAIPNSATATEYTVAGLTNDTAYFFQVRTVNSVGEGEASDEVTATPTATTLEPPEFSTGTITDTSIALSWGAVDNAESYTLTRVVDGGADVVVFSGNALTATDTGLTPETSYKYVVTATNSAGTSPDSDAVDVTTLATPPVVREFAENATGTVATFTAIATGTRTITGFTLGGTDAGHFMLEFMLDSPRGVLTFREPPNFEAPADANTDNSYEITVTATDSESETSAATMVTITVTDAEDAGSVNTITGNAQVGAMLTAGTVTDEDSVGAISISGYQWQRLPSGGDVPIDIGGDQNTYEVVAADEGNTLRVVVSYTDGFGGNTDEATSAPTAIVTAAPLALTAPDDQSYTADTLITPLVLSAASGGTGTLRYTLTGPAGVALPAGLRFDAGSRTLSGTPTAAAITTLTYTVTDTNDASTSQTFTVTVIAPLALSALDDQSYTVDTEITDLVLPAATGGTGLTYTLRPDLPDGLIFDADSRTLSGTPTVGKRTTYTYTATDDTGRTARLQFELRVEGPFFLGGGTYFKFGTLRLRVNVDVGILGQFPPLSGHSGDRLPSYTLTDLPPGLDFDSMHRLLTGAPTVTGVYPMTYTGTATSDSSSSTLTRKFNIIVGDLPSAPTGLTAEAGDTTVTLAWTAPGATGGAAITGYEYRVKAGTGGYGVWIAAATSPVIVAGLTNDTAYFFQVRAVNSVGKGEASDEVTPPDTTLRVNAGANQAGVREGATVNLDGTITNPGTSPVILWTHTRTNGADVTPGEALAITDSDDIEDASFTAPYVTVNTTLTFELSVTPAVDGSTPVTETVDIIIPNVAQPRAITGVTVNDVSTPADFALGVSWGQGSDTDKDPTTGFDVEYKVTGAGDDTYTATNVVVTDETAAITGLTASTGYTVRVRAKAGSGTTEVAGAYVTNDQQRTVPGAPTNLAAVPGDTTVTLTWDAASTTGGSGADITDYVVTYDDGDGTETFDDGVRAGTGAVVTGLANGTTYTFTVTARNATGSGEVAATITATPMSAINTPPVADAGPDQRNVDTGARVTLDGSGSDDPDGDNNALSYAWTQTKGRDVTLSGADTAMPTFTAPALGDELIFSLTVTDAGTPQETSTDTVTITVLAPGTFRIALEADTGIDGDGITSNGKVNVMNPGAGWSYTSDGGTTSNTGTGTGFTLDEGVYDDDDVQVTQIGEGTEPVLLGAVTVDITRPTVETFGTIAAGVIGTAQMHPITFSEAVDFVSADITADGAMVNSVALDSGSDRAYTIHFTPTEAGFSLTLAIDSVADVAGNTGPATVASATGTATPTANTAPVIGTADAAVDYAENTPVATAVATYTAPDAEGDTVTWTLGGTDAADFSIDTNGALTFNTVRDFETPASVATSNIYSVTITATDDGDPNESDTLDVTVTVTNVDDEDGMVAIAITRDGTTVSGAPRVGDTLTASVTDADSGSAAVTGTTWQWQSKSSSAGIYTDISGATDAAYSPVAGDVDRTLQAVATYNDSTGSTIATSDPTATVTAAPPGAPTGLTARPGDATVTLAWTAPGATGGADITGYEYRQSDATGDYDTTGSAAVVDWMAIPNSATATEYTVAGLTNDTAYFFQVRAVNSVGEGEASGEATATPTAANTAPVIGTADAAVDYAENTPVATAVATYTAPDAEGDTVTWTLGGTDAGDFSIDTNGALTFNTVRDFETPDSVATSNIYSVTITATDDGDPNESDTLDVTVTVTNVDDEAGVVAIAITRDGTTVSGAPRVGDTLTASVTDADSGSAAVTGTTWQWQSSSAGSTTNISGATDAAYSPVADDVDRTLQAVATYNDSTGSTIATSAPTASVVAIAAPSVTAQALTTSNANTGYAKAGDTLTLTFTVSKALSATPTATIAGQTAPVTTNANEYTATYTVVAPDVADVQGAVTYDIGLLVSMDAGADFDPGEQPSAIVIDTIAPTVSSFDISGSLTAGRQATDDIEFSEPVTGVDVAGFSASTNATIDSVTGSVDATTYTIAYTPVMAGKVTLSFAADGATDTAGNTGPATATEASDPRPPAPLVLTAPDDQNYTVDTEIAALTLPAATGGSGALSYTLTGPAGADLPTGLTFDAASRRLTGTPTALATTTLTYTVTDANATASQTFTVTVAAAPLALTAPDDQSYTVDTAITALTLPAATGGTGDLTYTLTGTLPAGLGFDPDTRKLTGTPTAVTSATTLTYTVTDSAATPVVAMADFTVTVALPRFADLNRTILPEVARAIAGHTVGAIARRVTQARADGGTDSAGSFNLGGQTTVAGVAGALASHGQAMADGTLSLKDLLGGGDFVLPLNARAAAGAPGLSSLAFWGAGDYSNLDGSGGAVDWDGDLFSAHLGADARLRDDLLVGLAVSWSRVDLDYSDPDRSGDYELDLTSFHPYVGWSALSGKLDLWATVGYGWGDLEIANEAQQASSDVEMRTVAVGGLGRLLKVGATTLRLKGDALLTEMEVEGSDEMAALTVDARRVRMILEGSRTHTLADGAQLEPSLEVGVRHDGGDGETGFGAELGGGVRYSNPVMGLTLEGRARTLVGRDSYGEWGVNGLIRLERGNGRGLSFNLSPGYGKTGSGTQRLWQQGLHDKIDGERDYGARMDLRLGYGLPAFGGRGLLTPYSEVTFGDSARNYRLGMEWELGALFELNLTGERHESSDGAADHAIMLKGEVRF